MMGLTDWISQKIGLEKSTIGIVSGSTLLGGLIGTFLLPGAGTYGGALVGSAVGSTAGAAGVGINALIQQGKEAEAKRSVGQKKVEADLKREQAGSTRAETDFVTAISKAPPGASDILTQREKNKPAVAASESSSWVDDLSLVFDKVKWPLLAVGGLVGAYFLVGALTSKQAQQTLRVIKA